MPELMADFEKRMKELQERAFEQRMRQFLDTWKPMDRREASDFEAQLIILVKTIYTDAQEPLLKHITNMLAAVPMFPTVPSK